MLVCRTDTIFEEALSDCRRNTIFPGVPINGSSNTIFSKSHHHEASSGSIMKTEQIRQVCIFKKRQTFQ